jgi:hypothetical protein
MIGLPFRIMPFVWTAVTSAGLMGVWFLVDEIGDRREAKVRAEYAEAQREADEEADRQGEEAEEARRPAALPGSVKRLHEMWCRDCSEARQ